MKVALYARVSTNRGEQDPKIQLEALQKHFAATDHEVVGEYVDFMSGMKSDRPGLGEAMALVRAGEVDAIAITKLDRLARSLPHLIQLAQELHRFGADLIVRDQAIDTSTPAGKLMFHMLGAIAEFERDLISDRTIAGIGAVDGMSRNGRKLGRPEREIDMPEAVALVDDLGSVTAAAERLGMPGRTLRRRIAKFRDAA